MIDFGLICTDAWPKADLILGSSVNEGRVVFFGSFSYETTDLMLVLANLRGVIAASFLPTSLS